MVWRQQTIIWWEQTIGVSVRWDKKRRYCLFNLEDKTLKKWYLATSGGLCRKTCKDFVKLR